MQIDEKRKKSVRIIDNSDNEFYNQNHLVKMLFINYIVNVVLVSLLRHIHTTKNIILKNGGVIDDEKSDRP